ncbi:MAG: GNAT family N-acetyltransferase [Candidatus Hydrogenedentes bacterium]|nr:GNAT family N-acetyltransferase [Candidatus Hydrogenedentota bacterium]
MSAEEIRIRPYRADDAERLAEIYRESVRELAAAQYNEAQLEAWAKHPDDLEVFRASLLDGVTLCAVVDDEPVAFAQLHPMDHIALTYCASAWARRGIMARLYRELEIAALQAGSTRLHTEASLVGRPFFERMGFSIVEPERVERHGVYFDRFRMAKTIG